MTEHVTEHDLTKSDLAWVRYYKRREAESFASVRSGLPPSSRARCLAMVKYASPAAYAAIVAAQPAAPVRSVHDPSSGAVIDVAE
jgi:hypothetical protein